MQGTIGIVSQDGRVEIKRKPFRDDRPIMTDEGAVKFRARLIEKGIIQPTGEKYQEGERGIMTDDCLAKYRARLIKAGVIIPTLTPGKFRPRYQ